ncbi:MAG: carboxypeptidase regulatory-like domain-containing protein [Kofleriaceae bacterium]|nr:carboxypeptidase regulatory-like domain-containing protein [Kofleriaceae bacterium]
MLLIAGVVAIVAIAYLATRPDRHHAGTTAATGAGAPDRGAPGAARRPGEPARAGAPEPVRHAAPDLAAEVVPLPLQIAGHVLDGAGKPVADVEVTFVSPGGEVIADSGADGAYQAEITTGSWEVRARGDGLWATPVQLRVASASGTFTHDVRVQRLGRVKGVVLRGRGQVVAGATVSVEIADRSLAAAVDQTVGGTATADRLGRFELAVPPGPVQLHAVGGPDALDGFADVAAVAPGAVTEVDIYLAEPTTIAGWVRGPDGGQVAGATVTASVRIGGAVLQREATTGADGRFRIEHLHPGPTVLEAHRAGLGEAETRLLRLDGGAIADDVELVLGAALALRGRVVDGAGAPVAGARVRAARSHARSRLDATSGDDGTFTITGAAAGSYELSTSVHGRVGRLKVELDADTGPVELVVRDPGGVRITAVAGATGAEPPSTITVAIERFVPTGLDRAATPGSPGGTYGSDGGVFSIRDLAAGTYDLRVTAPGLPAQRVAGVAVADGAWTPVEITFRGGARLDGVVTAGGKPVAGARVSIDGGAAAVFTDDAGRFAIAAAPVGPVTIAVAAEGIGRFQRSAVVGADGAHVEIALRGGGDVEGIGVLLRAGDAGVVVAGFGTRAPARGPLAVGDRIVAVDGVDVTDAPLTEVAARIRGPAGTQVTVQVMRGATPVEVTITRAHVDATSRRGALAAAPPHPAGVAS